MLTTLIQSLSTEEIAKCNGFDTSVEGKTQLQGRGAAQSRPGRHVASVTHTGPRAALPRPDRNPTALGSPAPYGVRAGEGAALSLAGEGEGGAGR